MLKLMSEEFVLAYYYFINMAKNNASRETSGFYDDVALKMKTAFATYRKDAGHSKEECETIQAVTDRDIQGCSAMLENNRMSKENEGNMSAHIRAAAYVTCFWLRDGKVKKNDKLYDNQIDFMLGSLKVINCVFEKTFSMQSHTFEKKIVRMFKEVFGAK